MKLYTPAKIEAILRRERDWTEELSRRYGIPAAAIRAVLGQELSQMDLLDPLADLAVECYWLRYRLRRRLGCRDPRPRLRRGPLGKRDSSTGYAQIFAYVAIRAIRFAQERGLAAPGEPADLGSDPDDPEKLREIWLRLHRDRRFSTECAALNLLCAAEEMTGRLDFAGYRPEEWKLIFTRYNADTRRITPYGEAVYQRYLRDGGA